MSSPIVVVDYDPQWYLLRAGIGSDELDAIEDINRL
jgi:hypothetical protein